MGLDRDQKLIRFKDVALLTGQIVAVVAFLSMVGRIYILAKTVEDSSASIAKVQVMVTAHDKQIAIADERWEHVQKQLDAIETKLDRFNRRRSE